MLLQEFWTNRFWPHCTRNLRESTRVGYESAWRLHVMPCFGGMGMDAISVELVDKWLAGFDSAGAARKAWSVLRAILRRAIRWNLLDVDITRRDIQLPAKTHYEPTILTLRQQRALLQGFYGHPLEAWLICAVSCGLRTEEGYGLEWGDIDLRSGVLHVERGLQWVGGHEAVVPPKTELSRRTLPLPRFAVKRLRELRPREGADSSAPSPRRKPHANTRPTASGMICRMCPHATCATHGRRTLWRRERISPSCRKCSATAISKPPRSTTSNRISRLCETRNASGNEP